MRKKNVLNGFSLLCHYGKKADQTALNTTYLKKISKHENIIYLPEKDTIFINENKIEFIGEEEYCVFKNNSIKVIDAKKIDIEKIINDEQYS